MAEVADRWHRTDRATRARVRTDRYGIGKRWLARWRDDPRVQRKRAFDRRADAERFLVEIAADLARDAYVDPRAGGSRSGSTPSGGARPRSTELLPPPRS